MDRASAADDALHLRALVLAPIRRDAHLTSVLLERARVATHVCADVEELCAEIARGAGLCVIAQEVVSPRFIEQLRKVLDKQPPWSDLPFVVLTVSHEAVDPMLERLAPVANVTYLERPVRISTLLTAVRASMRARQRQIEVRDFGRRKDEFLAMLGHELRNPLSAMQSAVALLHQEDGLSAPGARSRQVIERQLRHLGRIVDDILDVSRVTSGKIALDVQTVELNQVVQRWEHCFGETDAVRAHRVSVRAPPEAIYVRGDPVRLEQVLSNLMANALKYTPAGGRIEVSLEGTHGDAILRVRDDGIGIDADMLPRIFDLFTQEQSSLARSQGGLGLGLALVRTLAHMHGGTVSARSPGRDQGTEIEVRLPRMAAALEIVSPEPEPLATARPLRIVLIEDNDDGREMLQLLLEAGGHEVLAAGDGENGLGLILGHAPEVALVDIGLPGLDGYEVARRVVAAAPERRPYLVALTGYGQPDDRRRALEAGFDRHLVKPVEPLALTRLLAESARAGREVLGRAK